MLGNEDKCATIVTTLFERFEYSRFKLRLLFVDRRYQNNENNWYDRIVGKMDMQTRLWFQECSYNNKDMERIFDETHNADVANALAILEANEHTIYDPPAVFDSNKSEILLSTENKLKEIYEAFPNEGKVVLGYSYLVSWNYVTWLDFPRPIDEELIPLFKKWIRKFPENKLELMEYYSFILFEKWLYMDSLDNISEANKIYYEIKAIADELSKDYADNQVTQMLSMGIVRKL